MNRIVILTSTSSILLFIFACASEQTAFYEEITIDAKYLFEFHEKIIKHEERDSSYFRVDFDKEGRTILIEYFENEILAISPYFGIARIKFEYKGKWEYRRYFDDIGNPSIDKEGFYGMDVHFFESIHPVRVRKIGPENRVVEGSSFSGSMEALIGRESFEIIGEVSKSDTGFILRTAKYDEEGRVIEQSSLGDPNYVHFRSQRIGSTRYEYDDVGNTVMESYYDVDGNAIGISNTDIASVKFKHDDSGRVIWETAFDQNGVVVVDSLGIATRMFRYNDSTGVREIELFNESGQPIN